MRRRASPEPCRRRFFWAGASTTRVAGRTSARRISTWSPEPTPALTRWRPSSRMMLRPSSSWPSAMASAVVWRLPMISIGWPSWRPRVRRSVVLIRATPRPTSSALAFATCALTSPASSAIGIPSSRERNRTRRGPRPAGGARAGNSPAPTRSGTATAPSAGQRRPCRNVAAADGALGRPGLEDRPSGQAARRAGLRMTGSVAGSHARRLYSRNNKVIQNISRPFPGILTR